MKHFETLNFLNFKLRVVEGDFSSDINCPPIFSIVFDLFQIVIVKHYIRIVILKSILYASYGYLKLFPSIL
jgi:hypothetical protein